MADPSKALTVWVLKNDWLWRRELSVFKKSALFVKGFGSNFPLKIFE
jgi:hypothetical protein